MIKCPVKEKMFFPNHDNSAKDEEHNCMNHLAVRMGLKNFHGKTHEEMEKHLEEHVASGFIVSPVIYDEVGYKAHKEVD